MPGEEAKKRRGRLPIAASHLRRQEVINRLLASNDSYSAIARDLGIMSRGAPKPASVGRFKTGQSGDVAYTTSA
jgi:hypothetical protein